MDTEIRKRLEEAFVKWLEENRDKTTIACYADETLAHFSFNAGAELGYKEAIKVAKEWLLGRIRIEIDADGTIRETDGKIFYHQLAEHLEADMNKLWEEQK